MHSFTFTRLLLSFIFFSSFSLSLALSLRDWGFPVTWALGSPLLILSPVLHHISFSFFLTIFHVISISLCPLITRLSLSVSLSSRLVPLWCVSWAYYQCVCSVFVTGQLGRKEGRLMATEILSDSGPVQAVPMGSMCFLPLWNAREHPSTVLTLSAVL